MVLGIVEQSSMECVVHPVSVILNRPLANSKCSGKGPICHRPQPETIGVQERMGSWWPVILNGETQRATMCVWEDLHCGMYSMRERSECRGIGTTHALYEKFSMKNFVTVCNHSIPFTMARNATDVTVFENVLRTGCTDPDSSKMSPRCLQRLQLTKFS